MDFFIKNVFDGKNDELVHLQFQKFSRGEFKDRAVVIAKCSSRNSSIFKVKTSHEYANEFVRFLAEKLNERKTQVTGIIVSTRDLTNDLNYLGKKQFMGVKQYVIDREMSGKEILELCNKFPSAFTGLSFSVNGTELKVKTKAPKSSKPNSNGNNNVDFCKLKTSDKQLINNLIFDNEIDNLNFKEIEIKHDFVIKEIIISDEMKKIAGNDYSKLRELARRKGKIIRKINIDGKEIIKEKEFEV